MKNIYKNDEIGFSFSKPDSWFFLSKRNILEIRNRQILPEGSKELMVDFGFSKSDLIKFLEEPICVTTKYNPDNIKHKGKFSPTITIQATLKETVLGFWGDETFEDIIESSKKNMPDFLENFKLLKEYGKSKIDNNKSYIFDTSYTFKHEDLKRPITVEMKSIKIETNKYFIDINCHRSKIAKEFTDNEILDFIESIKLLREKI